MKKQDSPVLNIDQVAEMLHITKGTLLNWLSANRQDIRSVGRKVGGQWLFLQDDLLRWIGAQHPEE